MMIVYKVYKNMAFKVLDLLAFSVKMSCFPVVCVVETHSGPVQMISGQHRFHPALITLHTQACGSLQFGHDNHPSGGCRHPSKAPLLVSTMSPQSRVTAWLLDPFFLFCGKRNTKPQPVPRVSYHSTWKRSIDIE